MASKELTDLIQSAGAAGDGFVGLTASGELVRRDTVPFDADATPAASVASDTFVGLTATGDAKLFYAFPYNGPSTSATTPEVTDFVIGRTPGGDARAFTVASLATTLEGTSFGTAAFVNHGTAAGEVPLNSDLGELAVKDIASTADAESGTAGEIPDAAGVHAAISAVGYFADELSLLWSGSSATVDLAALPGGWPGDGFYYFDSANASTVMYIELGEFSSTASQATALTGNTLRVDKFSVSSAGVATAGRITTALTLDTVSESTFNITAVYKVI
ncbi:MAG: hypothetical protein VW258_09380 [Thalassolituus sp.]